MSIQVGDIGAIIRYTTTTDISAATVHKIKYRKPGGTLGEWAGATIFGLYSVQFITTLITDLDIKGVWQLQAYIEMPGWKGHSEIKELKILPNMTV